MSSNLNVLSVKDVNKLLKNLIEKSHATKDVLVRGEISNFTNHSSGHMYFSLKDAHGVLKIVMFKQNTLSLKFMPQNGMKVILRGDIVVYEKGGIYQIQAKDMIPDGIGSLHLAFEQLKEKLNKEGLFDPSLKKEIPILPKTIGVITSPTGAAVRDILTTIRRRFPIAKVILFPVLVQGEQAAKSIVKGIQTMNEVSNADVLIVGRGGGSIEDLWAFNEEIVARAIFNSTIPIISAVGHETDFTIADFVSDIRAATPTAAAEIATSRTLQDIQKTLQNFETRLSHYLLSSLEKAKNHVLTLQKALEYNHPEKKINDFAQSIDLLESKMLSQLNFIMKEKENDLSLLSQKLSSFKPIEKIHLAKETLERMDESIQKQMNLFIHQKREHLHLSISKLDQLSPLKTLSRGYSIVKKGKKVIKNIEDVSVGEKLHVTLSNGKMQCLVEKLEEI